MAPSSKDDDARADEQLAFAEAVRGARPLGGRRTAAGEPARSDEAEASRPNASSRGSARMIVEESGDSITGRRDDVATDVVRRLRVGTDRIEERLDLHGRTLAEAVRELQRFAIAARKRGRRVVLIVHGRGLNSDPGGPVVRPAVWSWLRGAGAARAGVLAFVTAPPRDGGAGATLVRLGK